MTSHDQAVQALGLAIASGAYGEGQMPTEPVLCQLLGVSRTVVREAIKTLVAKGLVITGPKVGTRVAPAAQWNWFDADVLNWLNAPSGPASCKLQWRAWCMAIQPVAVGWAASHADFDDVRAMQDALQEMRSQLPDEALALPALLAFHQALVLASGNGWMQQQHRVLAHWLRMESGNALWSGGDHAHVLACHQRLLRAIIVHDPEGAQQALAEWHARWV